MYKFPIRIPEGWKLTITQGFHENHNGNDVAVGTGPMTYGLPIVWPFPFPGRPYDIQVDAPLAVNATKARAQVDGTDPATGILYSVVYIHLSGALYTVRPGADSKVVFNEGDTIGFIGNSGAVRPLPTKENPFGGSHLHLGLGIKKPGELNAIMVDPSLYFDVEDPYRGADDPSRDQPVYDWANAASYRFDRNLWFGLFHQDVVELQKRLGVSPTYVGFGPKTLAAVIQYQKVNGILPSVGYVGPKTRESLNSIFS